MSSTQAQSKSVSFDHLNDWVEVLDNLDKAQASTNIPLDEQPAYMLVDPKFQLVRATGVFSDLISESKKTISLKQVCLDQDWKHLNDVLNKAATEGIGNAEIVRFVVKGDVTWPARVVARRLDNANGDAIGFKLLLTRAEALDKNVARIWMNVQESVKKQNDILYQIINANPNVIFLKNLDGQFVVANKALADLFNTKIENLLGKSDADFLRNPEEIKKLGELHKQVSQSAKSTGMVETSITNTKTGLVRWFEINHQLLNTLGGGKYILGVAVDITEKKEYLKELEAQKSKAEDASSAKSEFLANISHEIRTPMNAVLGFADLLSNSVDDPTLLKYINAITDSSNSLLTILNDILDLSKIEAGGLELEYNPVSVKKLTEDVGNMFSPDVDKKGLSFLTEYAPRLPKGLLLDKIRMRQILVNLIGNAIKFTDKGHVRVTALFTPEKPGKTGTLVLSVEDTGKGIAEEKQQVIFESFRQQDGQDNRKYGGTGLGLAITKKLTEAMGGHITLHSVPGTGSRFEVHLPGVKISDASPEVAVTEQEEENNFLDGILLILEPDQITTESVGSILEGHAEKIFISASGEETIDTLGKNPIDLIIVVLDQDGYNSFDTVAEIKKNPLTNHIPVVAISEPLSFHPGLIPGILHFDGFIKRPIDLDSLIRQLNPFLKYKNDANLQKSLTGTANNLEDGQNGFSPETKEKLKIIQIKVRQTQESMIISDIEDIGFELIGLGKMAQSMYLTSMGKEILTDLKQFEIEKVMECLERLNTYVSDLK